MIVECTYWIARKSLAIWIQLTMFAIWHREPASLVIDIINQFFQECYTWEIAVSYVLVFSEHSEDIVACQITKSTSAMGKYWTCMLWIYVDLNIFLQRHYSKTKAKQWTQKG